MTTPPSSLSNGLNSTNHSQSTVPTSSISSTLARGRKWMKLLCWIEFVLAVFALTLGSACTGINSGHERIVCTFGTGIWVGLLSLCIAIVGLVAIQITAYQQKLLVVYFIMCVLGALASVILLGISSMWIEKASRYYGTDNQGYQLASITLNVCLLIAAICQTVCTFLSAVLLSHYYWGWCCRSNDFTSSISYVRAEDAADSTISNNQQQMKSHHDENYYANSIRTHETEPYTNANKYFY